MKRKIVFSIILCAVTVFTLFSGAAAVRAAGHTSILTEQAPLFSGGSDIKIAVLLLLFSLIAVLPTFFFWDDQNGS